MRHWKVWLLLALAAWAGWTWWSHRPVARAAGVLAPEEPVQVDFDAPQLHGLLVEVDKPDGWRWRSSMTRADTGAGACEVVYVRSLQIEPR